MSVTTTKTNQYPDFDCSLDYTMSNFETPQNRDGVRNFVNRGLFRDIPNFGNNECKNIFIKRVAVKEV